MVLVFSQVDVLSSDLSPGISLKKHFHCHHFKEAGIIWQWGLSHFGGYSVTPGFLLYATFRIQPWQNSCRNVHIFIPFLWFLPWGKTDRTRKEMWESVCVLVFICWKRGLWEPFLGYGNVMNEVSWWKQLLQSPQRTAWLVPLFLQFGFFQMVLHLSWLSFIMFFVVFFPFLPSLSLFPFPFSWFILYGSHCSKNNYQGGKNSAYS